MKKTNFIYSLAATFMTAAIALGGLTACSSEDNIVNNNLQQNAEVKTYTVSIPASMGDDTQTRAVTFDNSVNPPTAISTFATTDKIYVYKKSPSTAWLSWNSGTSTLDNLSPNQNGKSCTLTGTITGQFAEGDVLELYYNMNILGMSGDPSKPDECMFDYYYWGQDGTGSGVADFAIATVKVKSIDAGNITFCQEDDTDDPVAHFENLSSMFRFKFTDGSNPISVKRLHVGSTNPALLIAYAPMATTKCWPLSMADIPVTFATATSDYFYVGIGIDESSNNGDAMTFRVEGADGKVYTGTKTAPTAGFKKGKYYYSTSATTLDYQYTIQYPDITWTSPSTGVEPNFGCYRFDVDNFDFTLSGTSSYVYFDMGLFTAANGTVRLNGLTATYDNNFYIYNRDDLTLDITGDNTITCKNHQHCIFAEGNLKLSGNGTLTVTVNNDAFCGLAGDKNYNDENNSYETTTELDVSALLAADGYTVTRSACTYNSSACTYTWTYTVEPQSVDLSALTGDYTAQDGEILSGTLTKKVKISIAAGATVTLKNANVCCPDNSDEGTNNGMNWAGITCEGDANIVLEGTNTARGFNYKYPGIYIPSGSTLTISGTGQLTASGPLGSNSCGIGGGYGLSSGNIVITSGTIIANGGDSCAGIGGGTEGGSQVSCGYITISGGTVTATSHSNCPGIGAGCGSSNAAICGDITLSGGNITVSHGNSGGGAAIGNAGYSNCSKVTITDGVESLTMTNPNASTKVVSKFINATAVYVGTTNITTNIGLDVDNTTIQGYISDLGFTSQSYDADKKMWSLTK